MKLFPDCIDNVSVVYAPVSAVLDGATACGVLWQAAPGLFLLDLPDVARYLVEGGNHVTVEAAAGVPPETVAHFARMTPLAALVFQRGMLAFHAAAVTNGRGAVLLAGDSGSGKSTLLLTLLERGWRMLADELAVVTLNGEGELVVHATSHEIALWPETLKKCGKETEELKCADANRLRISLQQQAARQISVPVTSIYWLGVHSDTGVTCKVLTGGNRFQALGSMLYNSHVAAALLDRVTYMGYCAALGNSSPVTRLYRPRGSWSVTAVADHIDSDAL